MSEQANADRIVRGAAHNRIFRASARAAYPISGVLHLVVSYIIVRIAIGSGGNADQSGALTTIAHSSGGNATLWVVAVGLVPLILWRLAEALSGLHPGERERADADESRISQRLKALGLAAVYCAVAFTAVRFALGSRKPSTDVNAGLSARLMQSDWGKGVLVIVGLVIISIGGYYIYKGAAKKFVNDLSVTAGRALTALGLCGYVAEGLVLCGAGVLVIVASVRSDPAKATGIDCAVKVLGAAPFGKVLIIVAAIGFACYGLYSFALTRCSRM